MLNFESGQGAEKRGAAFDLQIQPLKVNSPKSPQNRTHISAYLRNFQRTLHPSWVQCPVWGTMKWNYNSFWKPWRPVPESKKHSELGKKAIFFVFFAWSTPSIMRSCNFSFSDASPDAELQKYVRKLCWEFPQGGKNSDHVSGRSKVCPPPKFSNPKNWCKTSFRFWLCHQNGSM